LMAEIAAMQAEMHALYGKMTTSPSREPPKTPSPTKPTAPTGVADKAPSPTKPTVAESPTGEAGRQVESIEAERYLNQRRNESMIRRSLEDWGTEILKVPPLQLGNNINSAYFGETPRHLLRRRTPPTKDTSVSSSRSPREGPGCEA